MFAIDSSNELLSAALQTTQSIHASKQLQSAGCTHNSTTRYVLVCELGLHGREAYVQGTEMDLLMYDVSTAEKRSRLYAVAEPQNPWKAEFWRTFLETYFQQCYDTSVCSSSDANVTGVEVVQVLLPLYQQLRAVVLPLHADKHSITAAADKVCSHVQQEAVKQCSTAVQHILISAISMVS
jgi:hypothetical protein